MGIDIDNIDIDIDMGCCYEIIELLWREYVRLL